jgi:RNA polymerase sigma-70 factor (ECF subfamily)
MRSDADLVGRAKANDREAFAQLYRRHQGVIYRFACSMTGSATVAEDVVQEVFLTLMRNLGRYDPDRAALSTYLYGVARNVARSLGRKERRFVELAPTADMFAADDPAADLLEQQRVQVLRAAIRALPVKFREVIVLCDLHEVDYAQTASILGVPIGTVRSRLSRARQQVLHRMRPAEQPLASIDTSRVFT